MNLRTVKEVSHELRVSLNTVYGLVESGQLRAFRVGLGRGRVLIAEGAVEEYLRSVEVNGVSEEFEHLQLGRSSRQKRSYDRPSDGRSSS